MFFSRGSRRESLSLHSPASRSFPNYDLFLLSSKPATAGGVLASLSFAVALFCLSSIAEGSCDDAKPAYRIQAHLPTIKSID